MRLRRALLAAAIVVVVAVGTPGRSAYAAPPMPSLDTAVPSTALVPRERLVIDAELESPPESGGPTRTRSRPIAYEYSDQYNTRRKIHFVASFATLPLFAAQYSLGTKLYNGTASNSVQVAHRIVAGSVAALFGVNTITGGWNIWEARHDPNGRLRRILHGTLMTIAEGGFVASGLLAPDSDDASNTSDPGTHRSVAIASMGVATAGYLLMLLWR